MRGGASDSEAGVLRTFWLALNMPRLPVDIILVTVANRQPIGYQSARHPQVK
jgi:hypothetical protein